MPPLTKYTFKHKVSSIITITIEIYGDKDKAIKCLSNYVINTNDWYL